MHQSNHPFSNTFNRRIIHGNKLRNINPPSPPANFSKLATIIATNLLFSHSIRTVRHVFSNALNTDPTLETDSLACSIRLEEFINGRPFIFVSNYVFEGGSLGGHRDLESRVTPRRGNFRGKLFASTCKLAATSAG